jgi:hypothetical protein
VCGIIFNKKNKITRTKVKNGMSKQPVKKTCIREKKHTSDNRLASSLAFAAAASNASTSTFDDDDDNMILPFVLPILTRRTMLLYCDDDDNEIDVVVNAFATITQLEKNGLTQHCVSNTLAIKKVL